MEGDEDDSDYIAKSGQESKSSYVDISLVDETPLGLDTEALGLMD